MLVFELDHLPPETETETEMTVNNYINTHALLFAGLSVLPVCLVAIVQGGLIISGAAVPPNQLPSWVWYATFLYLFILIAIVGFVIACCILLLTEWQYWPLSAQWTRTCIIVFTVIWNIVFGFLSWLWFCMGMGASPQSTVQEVITSLFEIPLLAMSQAIVISLLISVALTVILVALTGGIVWCLSAANSTST